MGKRREERKKEERKLWGKQNLMEDILEGSMLMYVLAEVEVYLGGCAMPWKGMGQEVTCSLYGPCGF